MITFEAGSPDEADDLNRGDHVFEAIHTPPTAREVTAAEFRENRQGRTASQHDVLAALSDPKPFVFIAGVPGTGKSHLVRWLHMNRASVKAEHELSKYVPRRMTRIRQVLQAVLEYADDEVRSQLERDLESATAGLDEESARRQFLANLAEVIETRAPEIKLGHDLRFQRRDHVRIVDELHELLRARPVREYLCRDGGSIARIVSTRLTGERAEGTSADAEMRISEEELAGIAALNVDGVAKEAERLHSKIQSDHHQLTAAHQLLGPVHSDPALQRLIGIGTGQLQDAMTDLLASLHQEGRRLVLYFEDWGQISGFQEELAEAIAAAPEGSALAVVAITSDRLHEQRNNVLERGRIFVLDPPPTAVPGAELPIAHPGASELAGHGLNAIRWGREALRDRYDSRSSPDGWLPSKCIEACPFEAHERCFEAFGSTHVEGVGEVGYFPFSETALNNALNRKAAGSAAVPRVVLHEVVRPALGAGYSEQLSRSAFPSKAFAEEFRPEELALTGVQEATIAKNLDELGHPDERERVQAYLETYRRERGLDSFDDRSRIAFGLPEFIEAAEVPEGGPGDDGGRPPQPEVDSVAIPSLAEEALNWRRGEPLTAARDLRELAAREVLAGLPVYEPIWRRSEWARAGIDHTHIVLGEGDAHASTGPTLRIAQETADALAYLSWTFERQGGWREVESVSLARAITDSALDRWIDSVSTQLFADPAQRSAHTEGLMRVLAVSGIAAGIARELTEGNVLDVVFGQPASAPMTELDRVARGQRDETRQLLLRYVGFAQGAGEVMAIDYDFVAPIAERIVREPHLPDRSGLPHDAPDWAGSLDAELSRVVEAEFTRFASWWSEYGQSLSSRDVVTELISELRVMQARAMTAVDPATQVSLLRTKDKEAVNAVATAIDRVENSLESDEEDPFDALRRCQSAMSNDDGGLVPRAALARELQALTPFQHQLRALYLNTRELLEVLDDRLPEGLQRVEPVDTSALDDAMQLARAAAEELGS